jgi:hypothetical protein
MDGCTNLVAWHHVPVDLPACAEQLFDHQAFIVRDLVGVEILRKDVHGPVQIPPHALPFWGRRLREHGAVRRLAALNPMSCRV